MHNPVDWRNHLSEAQASVIYSFIAGLHVAAALSAGRGPLFVGPKDHHEDSDRWILLKHTKFARTNFYRAEIRHQSARGL